MLEKVREGQRRLEKAREGWRRLEKVRESVRKHEKVLESFLEGFWGLGGSRERLRRSREA